MAGACRTLQVAGHEEAPRSASGASLTRADAVSGGSPGSRTVSGDSLSGVQEESRSREGPLRVSYRGESDDARSATSRSSHARRSAIAGGQTPSEVASQISRTISHEAFDVPETVSGLDAFGRRASPLEECIESSQFQAGVGFCIATNIVVLVLETDMPHWSAWPLIDDLFVLIFAAELVARLNCQGALFFQGSSRWWAVFDCVLVALGFIEMLGQLFSFSESFMLFLRLHRLARMMRMFRIIPRLSVFFNALIGMGSTFMLIFSMIFLLILVSAIVCTHLFGHAEFMAADDEMQDGAQRAIKGLFCDVRTSLFSLFRVTTQDNWMSVAGPVIAVAPSMRLFFVVFIVFVSWTMISVLTAVASNSMIEATSDRKEAERRSIAAKHKAFIEFLRHCFEECDADGNGELDKDEFDSLVQQPRLLGQMKALGVDLSIEELNKTWQMLDVDGSGTLTIDAFVDGLAYLQDTLSVTHFFNLDQSVKRSGVKFAKAMDRVQEDVDFIKRQQREIYEHLREQARWKEHRRDYMTAWRKWAEVHDSKAFRRAMKAVAKVEEENAELQTQIDESPSPLRKVDEHDVSAT